MWGILAILRNIYFPYVYASNLPLKFQIHIDKCNYFFPVHLLSLAIIKKKHHCHYSGVNFSLLPQTFAQCRLQSHGTIPHQTTDILILQYFNCSIQKKVYTVQVSLLFLLTFLHTPLQRSQRIIYIAVKNGFTVCNIDKRSATVLPNDVSRKSHSHF